jgi:hypothetical protein
MPNRPTVQDNSQVLQLQDTVKSVAEAAVKHYQDKLDCQQRKMKKQLMDEEHLNCLIDKRIRKVIKEGSDKVKYVYVNYGGQQWPNTNPISSPFSAPVPASASVPAPQQQQQQPQVYYVTAPPVAHLPT